MGDVVLHTYIGIVIHLLPLKDSIYSFTPTYYQEFHIPKHGGTKEPYQAAIFVRWVFPSIRLGEDSSILKYLKSLVNIYLDLS